MVGAMAFILILAVLMFYGIAETERQYHEQTRDH